MSSPIRVMLVDDHPVFTRALADLLAAESDLCVIGVGSTAREALAILEAQHADVAVVDLGLGTGHRDGLDLVARLVRERPRLATLVLTGRDDPVAATEAVRAGALAFITKDVGLARLIEIIRGADRGEAWIAPHLLAAVLADLRGAHTDRGRPSGDQLVRLSDREREVLGHMVAGRSRVLIAEELSISVNTVRTHSKNILAKLEVHSSLAAVSVAVRGGLAAAA